MLVSLYEGGERMYTRLPCQQGYSEADPIVYRQNVGQYCCDQLKKRA